MQYCNADPSCRTVVDHGACAIHACPKDQYRGSATDRGYDWAWSQYAKVFLSQHPICGERADGTRDVVHSRCAKHGRTTVAQCVDHTIPMQQGGGKWDPDNHMACCFSCNTWKARTLERTR